jgi:predicted acylesterase/phospholipase RssA
MGDHRSERVTTAEPPPRFGFVLSGGGAYAAYEVGVMRALTTGASPATAFEPIDAEVVTGTSGGSVNAAIFATAGWGEADAALDYLERAWIERLADQPRACGGNVLRLRANPLNLLDAACLRGDAGFYSGFLEDLAYLAQEGVARGSGLLRSPGGLRQRAIEAFDLGTLITGDPLRQALLDIVDFERVRHSPRDLRIAATNWRTGELRVFRNEDMNDGTGLNALLASTAIPGIFPSVEIDRDPYVDGGVVMSTPLRPAIQAGATDLHVVYMDPDVQHIPLPRLRNTLNTLYRMLVISFGVTVSRDIRTAAAINRRLRSGRDAASTGLSGEPRERRYRPLTVHRYHPTEDLGGTFRWLEFDRDHIVRLIQRGYEDTRVHDCRANRCVIEGQEDEVSRAESAEWVRRDA